MTDRDKLDIDFNTVEHLPPEDGRILVAQADTPTPPAQSLLAQPAADGAGAGTGPTVIALEDGNIARLPADASIDAPRVNGTDLEFVQPDGSVIVIPNGAVQGLTLFIGTAEIPPTTVAALFEANDIQAAAGPGGAGAGAGGPGSSGGNFAEEVGDIPDALEYGGLLPPTALLFDSPVQRPDYEGLRAASTSFGTPTAGENLLVRLNDDEVGAFGNLGGTDDDASSNTSNTLAFDYGSSGPGSVLWSDATLPAGFSAVISGGGTILTILQGGTPIFVATLSDTTSGAYSIVQQNPASHPTAGASEENFDFVLQYTVTDGNGTSTPGTLPISLDDDTPTLSVSLESEFFLPQLEVDETSNGNAGDRYNIGESEDLAGNANTSDDVATYLGQVRSAVGGGLTNLFSLGGGYGADGPGTTVGTLSFVGLPVDGTPVATNLSATDGGLISLVYVSPTQINGVDDSGAGQVVFSIEIVDVDPGAGTDYQFQLTLFEAIRHTDANLFDSETTLLVGAGSLSLQYAVTRVDSDGDPISASASLVLANQQSSFFSFDDDGPSLSFNSVTTGVTLDETIYGPTTDGVFSSALTATSGAAILSFTSNYGADGAGSTVFKLTVSDAASGLATAQGDHPITLVQTSDTLITGTYNDGGTKTAFTVSIDTDGKITVTQNVALEHQIDGDGTTPAGSYDDSLSLLGKIAASVTVTDADGDTATSGNRDIGGAITFKDDGPSLSFNSVTTGVTLDETIYGPTTDGVFSSALTATSGAAILSFTSNYGADGAGSTVFKLTVSDAASGLATAQGDHPITLVQTSDTLITGTYNDGGTKTAFTVSIDTDGKITVTQNVALEHQIDGDGTTPAGSYDDSLSLLGKIAASVTVTDADGDTATSGNRDIGGAITFKDDGPSLSFNSVTTGVTLDETIYGPTTDGVFSSALTATSGAAILSFTSNYGADGAGSTVFKLTVSDAASGLATAQGDHPITLVQTSDTLITGTYNDGGTKTAFTVSIDTDGKITVTQNVALEHQIDGDGTTPAGSYDDSLSLLGKIAASVTVTDADGDTATSGNRDIGGAITFKDDGPSLSFNSVTTGVTLDETIYGPTTDGVFSSALTATSGAAILSFTSNYGADGAGSTVFKLTVSDAASGLATAQGDHPITLVQTSDTLITGTYNDGGTKTAFTVSIDTDGKITVTQNVALEHQIDGDGTTPAGSYDDSLSLLGKIAASVTVTDADGDTATSGNRDIGGAITFKDDGPSLSFNSVTTGVTLDETIYGPTTDGEFSSALTATSGAAILSFTSNYGADGAGSTVFKLTVSDAASGLATAQGDHPITLVQTSDTLITGTYNDGGTKTAFTVSIDTDGKITVTQNVALEHQIDGDGTTPAGSYDDSLSLLGKIAASVTVTDADGDTATSGNRDIGGAITFKDDGPAAAAKSGVTASALLDESNNTGYGTDGIPSATILAATIAGLFEAPAYGADGSGTTTYALSGSNGAQTGLWLTGQSGAANEIVLFKISDTQFEGHVGSLGGTLAFTVSIDGATGAVTVTQSATLEHTTDGSTPTAYDDSVFLTGSAALKVVQTVTDGDGDKSSATSQNALTIEFQDDGPKAASPDQAVVKNAAGSSATFSLDADQTLSNNFGADGGTIRFPSSLDGTSSGLTSSGAQIVYHVSSDGHTLTGQVGNTVIFTLQLDPTTATYSVQVTGLVDSTASVSFSDGGYEFTGGNFDFAIFGTTASDDSKDLLMTAIGGNGRVNTSSVSGGVGDGGSVDPGEAIRIDFVQDATSSGNGSNLSFSYEAHYNSNGASALFTATNNGTVTIRALDDFGDGTNGSGVSIGNGIPEAITNIAISYGGETKYISPTATPTSYVIGGNTFWVRLNSPAGTVTIDGLQGSSGANATGTRVAAYTADGYSSLEFSNSGTDMNGVVSDGFKLGQFGASVPTSSPVAFNIPVDVVDGDGDAARSSIGVTLSNGNVNYLPVPGVGQATATEPNIVGTTSSDTLLGDSGDNVLSGGDGNDTLQGNSGRDTLLGGAGSDAITGGAGADVLSGGVGVDAFNFAAGDSPGTISGAAISGFDVITDFDAATDKLNLIGTPAVRANTGAVNGSDVSVGSTAIKSHSVTNGMIFFDADNTFDVPVSINSNESVAAAVTYIRNNAITGGQGGTVAFTATLSGVTHVFIYQQAGASISVTNDLLIDLVNPMNWTTLAALGASHLDPLIIDLDHNGYAFSSLSNGVAFDINADGTKDQMAWNTSGDGILAIDLNHDGVINDGSELFTPDFNHQKFVSGSEALASLDSNQDGVIDANDEAFADLVIWKDTNADGVTDAGELSSLADNGILSIEAPAQPTETTIDGQTIAAQGTVTFADGSTTDYVEVALDTVLGDHLDGLELDYDNVLIGNVGHADTLSGTAGSDLFVLTDLEAADLVTDYNADQGDRVDLSVLLGSASGATAETIANFVQLDGDTLRVDVDGTGTAHGFVDVAHLDQPLPSITIIVDDSNEVVVNQI